MNTNNAHADEQYSILRTPDIIHSYHVVKANQLLGFQNHGGKRINGATKGVRYYGIELEVEVHTNSRERMARSCLSSLGAENIIMMDDASLTYGFEIISAPLTIDNHYSLWPKLAGIPKNTISSFDTDSCGMHIHASKSSVRPLTLGKLMVFVHARENKSFINMIAQRNENSYCERASKKITAAIKNDSDRHQAINLCNEDTIEFRFFKGNLIPERILKNIEFIESLIQYCDQCSIRSLDYESYLSWLSNHKPASAFKILRSFISGRISPCA